MARSGAGRARSRSIAGSSTRASSCSELFLMTREVLREVGEATRQKMRRVRPRVTRGGSFPFLRAVSNVLVRDLTTRIVLSDLRSGVPTIYATYVGYDVVAHHAGPHRPDALSVLARLDRETRAAARSCRGRTARVRRRPRVRPRPVAGRAVPAALRAAPGGHRARPGRGIVGVHGGGHHRDVGPPQRGAVGDRPRRSARPRGGRDVPCGRACATATSRSAPTESRPARRRPKSSSAHRATSRMSTCRPCPAACRSTWCARRTRVWSKGSSTHPGIQFVMGTTDAGPVVLGRHGAHVPRRRHSRGRS